jgi:hypothetical protein
MQNLPKNQKKCQKIDQKFTIFPKKSQKMLKVHPKSEKSDQKRTKILKKCAIIDKIF